jgi:hypothetical protein
LKIYQRHLIDEEAMTEVATVRKQLTNSDMQQELRLMLNTRKWVQQQTFCYGCVFITVIVAVT